MKTEEKSQKVPQKRQKNSVVKKDKDKTSVPVKQKTSHKRLKSKPHRRIPAILIIILAILILGFIAVISVRSFFEIKKESTIGMVNSQLSYCQELVVGKYKYSDVIALKKSMGFAKSYSIVKFTGIIRAGIKDVSQISYEISNNRREIVLKVPPAEILGNEIISQDIFDEKQSIFVRITAQELFEEIDAAKAKAAEELITDGLLTESRNHAIMIIKQFMYGIGFETVIIK